MAEIKDKVVTVESLSVLHEHNKNTYMPVFDPVGSGTMTINGDGNFSGNLNVSSITIGSNIKLIPNEDGLKIEFLNQEIPEEPTPDENVPEDESPDNESSSEGEDGVTDNTETEEEIIEES